MSPERLAARLLHTFLAELDDQLGVLEGELLTMERGGEGGADSDRMNRIFRVAHTLKGAARVADVPLIERTCHALESRLAAARADRRPLTRQEVDLLLSAVDALADAGRRLRRGEPVEDGPLGELERRLNSGASFSASAPGAAAAAAATAVPTAEPPHVERRALAESGPPFVRDDPDPPYTTERRRAQAQVPGFENVVPQVRVEASRLDELLRASGQLAVTVARTDLYPERLDALASDAASWLARRRLDAPGHPGSRHTAMSDAAGAAPAREQADELHTQFRRLTRELKRLAVGAHDDARAIRRAVADVSEELQRLRLRPFGEAVSGLHRMVRDIASASGKQVALQLAGTEVEADRAVLDALREALMHLVRNAVDHGIEPPDERVRAGKPREGTVRVTAQLRGAGIRVTVSDDGRGLDTGAVRRLLTARGLDVPESEEELAEVLFQGGFSTRSEATEISGRGVGLDVVRDSVERIRGSVRMRWDPGIGTTFVIHTPLALATQRMLLVSVGEQPIAIPDTSVARLFRVDANEVREGGGRRFITTSAGPIPLASLGRVLGPPLTATPHDGRLAVVLLEDCDRRLGVAVDALLDETELVVHRVERRGGRPLRMLAGAAMLADGRVALVLNPSAVVSTGLGRRSAGAAQGAEHSATAENRAPVEPEHASRLQRLLVVDDSITTRTLEQSVLEGAGYEVITAVDGADGWRQLQERGADLVITDIEMPEMDGFALCRTIRSSRRHAQLPIILVTSLEDPEHRAHGIEAGADAYVVKSGFDQEALLAMVRELLASARR